MSDSNAVAVAWQPFAKGMLDAKSRVASRQDACTTNDLQVVFSL